MIKKLDKKVVKNFSWALLGRIFAAVCQTLGIILLARWETVNNFGLVVSILAITTVLIAFIDFGLNTFMIKERAKDSSSTLVNYCIKINSTITFIAGSIFFLIILLLGFYTNSFFFYILPLTFWLVFEKRNEQLLAIYIADGNNKKATQLLTIRRFLGLLLFIILFNLFNINPSFAYSISILVSSVLLYKFTIKDLSINLSLKFDYKLKILFKETFPYWINSLFAQLRNIDVTIVSLISTPIHAAYFGFINRAVAPLNMVATSMASVVLPSVSKKEINNEQFYFYLIFTTFLSSIPFIILFFTVDLLIPFALGVKYIETIPLFKIICVGLIFFSASSITASILQGIDLQKKVANVNIISTSTYLIILIPLTLYGGSLYATYSLIFFFLFRFILMSYYLIKSKRKTREI